jgi:hypothetical protein
LKSVREYIQSKKENNYFIHHEIYEVIRIYEKIIQAYKEYASWGVEIWYDNDDNLLKELTKIILNNQNIQLKLK